MARMTLDEAMGALEAAGSAQARKTYARHGATGPMFGTSFATIKALVKRIGVDHDLARGLIDTGNYDARNLGLKVADPARVTPEELDRWVSVALPRTDGGFVGMLAAESAHGRSTADRWLAASDLTRRCAGWGVASLLAQRDPSVPTSWFEARLVELERDFHAAPNDERHARNGALIAIGGRGPELRDLALAAARRIGPVTVDHGDTSCKTPDAAGYVEKTWVYAALKGFASPTAQESARKPPRTRC